MSKIKELDSFKHNDEADGEGSGQGSGVAFADFVGRGGALRDDQLPPDEKRRRLKAHAEVNYSSVIKGKETRKHYDDLKNGTQNLADFRQGRGQEAGYKPHPNLSDKVQFSGSDKQEIQLPSEQIAKTQDELRNDKKYNYNKKFEPNAPAPAPTFNPTPTPYKK